jgi:hypothetical protein
MDMFPSFILDDEREAAKKIVDNKGPYLDIGMHFSNHSPADIGGQYEERQGFLAKLKNLFR